MRFRAGPEAVRTGSSLPVGCARKEELIDQVHKRGGPGLSGTHRGGFTSRNLRREELVGRSR
uniref:Uncharacterized protein n=1 Tax=Oryza sativa subsp. japonica TaxID=39947 RepID=Q6ZFI3_ORYSJ|nr:hypothetical protein [Oryza sativa Japonica Group]BAD09272.1 hypothetical protein [Oryza sativa Japonica Group]